MRAKKYTIDSEQPKSSTKISAISGKQKDQRELIALFHLQLTLTNTTTKIICENQRNQRETKRSAGNNSTFPPTVYLFKKILA
jgi:hypothetical protein